ncbi:ABC transporter substrate-binding protein [Alkalibacter saccharofermentans]|uniref:Polar amino acid transport system substrate-binding protein n=1 Tax=Alkalibacter saccharofermentans DSM 14828 TaxID=1120975 RepID=A0A1M4WJF4_9FIRM|nr:ABC transporter substrate-binding protein [Alkalibacter saccharofermentans]SHE81346.1 polar amino acid transport system substrate-binding protein [Alkalibacter saccharofermentans DSM 14828]
MKKISAVLLVALLSVVLLAGCGSSAETTYEQILEDGEMTFAMTGAYPPFNFIDENGDLAGFDIDIANAIAEKMGVVAVPITTEWDGIIGGLTGNRFDMIIGSMAITEARLEQVNFSDPYYYDGAQFFAPVGSGLSSIDDLEDGRVGVVTGTTFHDALEEMDSVGEILQFSSDVDNFMAVQQGRSDGLVTGIFVGLQAPAEYGVDIEPIGDMLYSEEIAIAIRKDDTDLLNAVNDALAEIIEDGTYAELSNKWFGVNLLEIQN